MIKKLLPLIVFLGLITFPVVSLAQSTYSLDIDISEQASVNLTNYQVDLTINTEALILAGKMNADGSDIRFYSDACLTTQIPFWVESGINTTSTMIWVNVPSIPANAVTSIYMGYGDPLAVSSSDFAATFPSATISGGASLNLTGTIVTDWFQLDAGDVLTLDTGSPLSISARKIIINGTVNGTGAGYAGGASGSGSGNVGSGPGGGTPASPMNSGCGGGSYGGIGGTGGFDAGDTPGFGGAIYGTDSGTDFDMGSGGGASDLNFGGNGGGAFAMNAEYITITGTINMNGTSAQQPGGGRGAGGGAGGSVVAVGKDLFISGTISANGGSGSIGTSTANDDGGSGAGGRIKFLHSGTLTNTGTTSVLGGPVGTNGTGGAPTVGGAGVVFTGGLIVIDDLIISTGAEVDYNFTPTIITSGSFCVGETVTLTAGGNYGSYAWSPSGETNSSIDVTVDGTYTLTAGVPGSPAGCNFTETANITIAFNPIPSIDLGLNDTICETATVTLDAGSGFSAYSWSTGPTTQTVTLSGATLGLGSTTIEVEVTDANGCTNTDDIVISVEDCTIGLDENDLISLFEVYPNPVTDYLMVRVKMANEMPTKLSISDMSGKIVYTQSNFKTQDAQLIDVSTLQAGTYFVELYNANGRATRMIVKN
ncbi:MAG: DUF2341 domain-containing protein [Flavobacteriales bacterium]|nr:DUF2341 domain-containing protein [Flavobacteriales bacterium]